jgi:dTMP kinase
VTVTRGRLIAFEGGEACGKSTQARLLAERLGARLTREPGGTPTGEQIRTILLDHATGDLDPRAETLLVAAARAEHVATVIRPALDAGQWVVTDRFSGSSLAYQGAGRGLPVDEVADVSRWATAGLEPDLVVLLDVPPEVSASRQGGGRDRLEEAGDDFHLAVAEEFRKQAAAHPEQWVTFDGDRPVDDLAEAIAAEVARRLSR